MVTNGDKGKIDVSLETEEGDMLSIKDLQRVDMNDASDVSDGKVYDTTINLPGNRTDFDGDDEESIEEEMIEEVIAQEVYSSEKKDDLSTQEIPTALEFRSMIER